jgi:hypothetical protein
MKNAANNRQATVWMGSLLRTHRNKTACYEMWNAGSKLDGTHRLIDIYFFSKRYMSYMRLAAQIVRWSVATKFVVPFDLHVT